MVFTRACTMDPEKSKRKSQNRSQNKNRVKNLRSEKSVMKTDNKPANSSNPESEEDDPSVPVSASIPSGSGGSSIKVTLKKTRSCSSSSSRESTQSFESYESEIEDFSDDSDADKTWLPPVSDKSVKEDIGLRQVVRSVPPASDSVSGEEDGVNQMENTQDKISNKEPSDDGGNEKNEGNEGSEKNENELEKESEEESQHMSDDFDGIEISSDDSQESFAEKEKAAAPVKDENSDEKSLTLNPVVHLKSEEIPQNSTVVKKEECKTIKIKSLKEELLKEADIDNEIVVLKDDDDNLNDQVPQPQNGVAKKELKEQVKEQKFKVNVRSFDDLISPHTVNLFNIPPHGQIDGTANFLSQNGTPFPPPYMACEVCGIQFDSSELLNEHKTALKHYKCSYKECEHLVISSQQEFLDHQRLIHNMMQSPVQQLAHQVQRLPSMGFDQQLQSGVPPLPENMPHPSPNMYSPSLRMPNQPVPMQRSMRPMMRPAIPPHMMATRGRSVPRASRGRGVSMSANMSTRGGAVKRPTSMPVRGAPPLKRVVTDRNSYTNNMSKTPQIVKSLSESITKSLTSANKSPVTPSQQDVVNLFSKRGLTISTVDTVNNISLPAGLSLNSAVSIIPTSPQKVSNNLPSKVSHKNVPLKSVDTVDLTGPDKPREKKFFPCETCSKTYSSVETLYEHISTMHKSIAHTYKCNLCSQAFPSGSILNHHKTSFHKLEVNSNIPFVIPIYDLNKPGISARMQAMGVTNYLPVAQLDSQGGNFGVPIMSISRPGTVEGLKYTDFFNLGSIRKM